MFIAIYIFIACFFVYWVGFYMGKKKKTLSHQHIWEIRSAKTFDETPAGAPRGRKKTRVLRTCFCNKYDVDILDGHWELEEIKAIH